ncbi:SP17 protein, partial [Nothoprocta ornata]|nr:SP17 protein [Nothoprocta ornata]
MAIPFSNTRLRVPAGFRELLEGLAREVLRAQPRDVVAFAAEHFQALLEERERSGADPAAWGSRLED